jgi:hypothetical protein
MSRPFPLPSDLNFDLWRSKDVRSRSSSIALQIWLVVQFDHCSALVVVSRSKARFALTSREGLSPAETCNINALKNPCPVCVPAVVLTLANRRFRP